MRWSSRWRFGALTAIIASAGLAGGCGRIERVGADRTLNIALTEYRLNPKRATASPGTLTLIVHNFGRLSHDLVVAEDGRNTGSTKAIPPGQTAVLQLYLYKGSYELSSSMLSDALLGARATLKVT
jgi:hypothetical protein